MVMARAIMLFCFSLLLFRSYALVSPGSSSSATADELALLSFKSMLSSPSEGLLASWNTSSHFCSWAGVSCSRRHHERVVSLHMNSFNLSGRISPFLGNLSFLRELDFGGNKLVGEIPAELGRLIRLQALNLSYNQLQGWNKLSGEIPSTLGECQLLQIIDLRNNILNGSIPSLLGQLQGLEYLDLSRNNLSGQMPKFLGNLSMLYKLNLSFNSFVGQVPIFGVFANATATSIQGNDKLCGGIPDLHLPPCYLQFPKKKHKLLVVPIVISLAATLAILSSLYMLLTWRKRSTTKTPSTTFMQGHPLISYSELVRATDGFSPTNLLGSGSFGSVYKGELDDQDGGSTNLVAVKVLKLQTPGALKSFIAECEALRNMRHRNLVKIVTACASIDARGNDFKAIVYDFMPNGSLEGWLRPDVNEQTEQRYLDLAERVTILLDVAYALHYLHCDGPAPVIHCDLKSSNVLLDADMVAHVGDFGLAKIIVEGSPTVQHSTSSMGFRGTIGYAAPEYGAGNVVSTNGDIYSYGVLVLEMVTGKRPTDSTFGQGLSLREYVELALHNRMMDVIDMRLSLSLENELQDAGEGDSSYKRNTDCLIALLRLGLSCSEEMPSCRMPTGDIIKELLAIKGSIH
ncbi:receptor kinase-like protein Xa21 isoform X2 [Phragmites australis]|uniref:receptor kinase-like protein Xa21 isoform X2 n=1 Tax=Phragmites australis TaxID=29695 RepID=UPI002D7828C5|nr:receptor kinase-like protein Xa21 isoform X2 [Phragmites australis]